MGWSLLEHPRVRHYLAHRWSVVRGELEKRLDQIFEVLGEEAVRLTFGRLLPKEVSSVDCQALVVDVVV